MNKKIYAVYAGAIGEQYEFSSTTIETTNDLITEDDICSIEHQIMEETNYIYDTVIVLNWKEIK